MSPRRTPTGTVQVVGPFTVTKRPDDWHACITGNTAKWGSGATIREAIVACGEAWADHVGVGDEVVIFSHYATQSSDDAVLNALREKASAASAALDARARRAVGAPDVWADHIEPEDREEGDPA